MMQCQFVCNQYLTIGHLVVSLRIQPPLIRSRYYVRNAKRDDFYLVVSSLRILHVVAGENERRLYSQATFELLLQFIL